MEEKIFLVFNTACFGDVLICNSLCRGIKKYYPDSKLIFIVNKGFEDVAKYQDGVDEVFVYDKKGVHKGLSGFLRFIKEFPYRKVYASFVTYRNTRNVWVSRLVGAKRIYESKKFTQEFSAQEQVLSLLGRLVNKELENFPIVYNAPSELPEDFKTEGKSYITLCTTSKRNAKDMPLQTAVALINKINAETCYKVVFTGAGQKSLEYAQKLTDAGCDFINFVNKTTIPELATVLKSAKALITVDTGTMHLGYAVSTPLVVAFYESNMSGCWAPDTNLYKAILLENDNSADNIYDSLIKITSI